MRRNGMGPDNQGPRTGWGLGNCPASEAEVVNRDSINDVEFRRGFGFRNGGPGPGRGLGSGRGLGFGRGMGRGRRGNFRRGMGQAGERW